MRKLLQLITVFFLLISLFSCQNGIKKLQQPANGYTVAFYNVENIFDTIDDPTINDEEFLPNAKTPWNTTRYNTKLDNIGKVIASMDTLNFPMILGLAEIENRAVLNDLKNNKYVAKANYDVVHFEGKDPRGIEVAMLYQPKYLKVIHKEAKNFVINDTLHPRHILYVKAEVANGDTLHFFVNHWTSRYGGTEQTIPARTGTAAYLRTLVDSLFAVNIHSRIIISGDFNDNPEDPSMFTFLKAYAPDENIQQGNLYNLALEPHAVGQGTLFYKGWDFFDQMIVSSELIQPKNGTLKVGEIEIIKKKWMLFQPKEGEARPNRTASGGKYHGGFSDHLPVMIRIK